MNQNTLRNMRSAWEYSLEIEKMMKPREEAWRKEYLKKYYPQFDKDEIEKMELHELKMVIERLNELKRQKEADNLIERLMKKD